ncbi:hypothetical protein [uncultured Fibrella sp.]|uniref:hypothetical protein n=1 Tax=uncultured Fibrella sp. TaxID=1284596 RepID=UPI0035CB1B58
MKPIKYAILLIVCLLWVGGCSKTVMHLLYETGIIADDYRYGDLYRLSNLAQFKDPAAPCPPRAVAQDSTRTHLYVIGDSFTEPGRLGKQDVPVSYFRRVQWDEKDTVQLDPSAHNVLLIESVERHFREHAASSSGPIENLFIVADTNRTPGPEPVSLSWGQQLVDLVHSKGIEEQLETVLFSHDLFLWVRELKAALTLRAFDRVSPTVSLSHDKQHIFTGLDTDTTNRFNAGTSPLPKQELTGLVQTINETAARYQSAGFNRVILSIIPNKSTILDPGPAYNHLIERVQGHARLTVPVVDTYSQYRQHAHASQPLYALGDSHWNCTGRAIWLDELAKKLR